jgi:HSP20 family protein
MFGLTPWRITKAGPPLPILRDEFAAVFDRMLNHWPELVEPPEKLGRFWNVEMMDNENEVMVRAEVPGFEAPDLVVELLNNRLLIRAEKKIEATDKTPAYTERHYERFVELPIEIDPAKVDATYRNGVLEVHLPKAEAVKPHRIPVR